MDGENHDRATACLRRAPVLRACREGPQSRRDLESETGASRTTAYRATNELEERGLLERENGGYRTTATGEATSRAVDRYLSTVETIDRLEPLFERIDHPELLDHAHLLADAELTVADEENMYRANDRAVELFAQSETIRASMTGSGSRLCIEESTAAVAEGEMDVEMCFTPEALPTSDHLDADIDRLFERLDIYVVEGLPFAFVLHDEVATVVAHNEVGVPIVVAETDDPAAYRWLEARYAEYRTRARRPKVPASD
jgi:predicted transcriptional regulator